MTESTWTSTPWAIVGNGNGVLHKRRVPYVSDSTYLQTLDLWIPSQGIEDIGTAADSSAAIPCRKGPWIVYIHGGAWRDPLVDSSSFEPTALRLLERTCLEERPAIAGIASLNYRLSQHPRHPTHPSPPRDPEAPVDPSRTAKHPDHICDVLAGLSYLQKIGALGMGYILAGHSCGAMLAFQAVMDHKRWGFGGSIPLKRPQVIVGLNGLYDLPRFLSRPDESHGDIAPIYDAFTRGAFGQDKEVWASACPTAVDDWSTEWPEGRKVVLAQSHTDELVPYSQTAHMKLHLTSRATTWLRVEEVAATGRHNEMWQIPEELVRILLEVVESFEELE
ncbi:alpha/beta hydrolase [Aspergillus puulaauensis]|uniref:Kynurenine formamidase n=1 Tax=Aspergillus puulaauensis TaxID=1220207 RepID=A0A7R7XQ32_9EURO|nr:uncharacterized protein APUU_50033A [Aspergillus puulaauensis]BCS25322.1 hypothetical protein APUU_50033A [Aspergillus puulaauensis]